LVDAECGSLLDGSCDTYCDEAESADEDDTDEEDDNSLWF